MTEPPRREADTPTQERKSKIEAAAQGILDARALYPDCSLADLYDPLTMPPELRKAHQMNDKAVMEAYGLGHQVHLRGGLRRLPDAEIPRADRAG